MNTAIIINLDYETFSIVKCRKLWRLIEDEMADAGFYKSIRLFITPVDTEVAFARARDVLQNIERTFRDDGEDVLLCVREFYGIPYANVVDLALPSSQEITVDFMAAGTFQNLFPGHP